jgi:hypothetical protein
VIQDLAIAAILAGAGILATRWWQRRMDRHALDVDPREERIQKFHERQRDEMRVQMRDA